MHAVKLFCFCFLTTNIVMASAKMRAVQFEAGPAENLYIGQVDRPSPKENEVLIKVIFSAINRADTLQRQGRYAPPAGVSSVLGLEAVGMVEEAGPQAKWAPGQRVMALLAGGGNAEYAVAHTDHVMPVPDDMTLEQAAAIPEVWLTAYQLLHTVGGVQQGARVLIHAGASGVGTAAVQLARLAGALPYVTAGSEVKLARAAQLGAVAGINYKTQDFAEEINKLTEGQGVNLILDCVGGSYWQRNLASLAVDGTWVLYGLLGGPKVEGDLLGGLLRKRITLKSSLLRSRSIEYKAALVSDFASRALPHFASTPGLRVVIDRVFPLGQIREAHKYMESNVSVGKILLQVATEEVPQHDEF